MQKNTPPLYMGDTESGRASVILLLFSDACRDRWWEPSVVTRVVGVHSGVGIICVLNHAGP